jgi:hypothetical protein
VLTVLLVVLESLACVTITLPPLGASIAEALGTDAVRPWLFLMPLPLGLLDITAGAIALLRSHSTRKQVGVLGIVVGVLGVLTGLFWGLLLASVFGQVY